MKVCELETPVTSLNDVLEHLSDAVEAAIRWHDEEGEHARKRATVQMLVDSFHACFGQSIEAGSADDDMEYLAELHPEYSRAVTTLKQERGLLRFEIDRLAWRLDGTPRGHHEAFRQACEEVLLYLKRFRRYQHKEARLLQEAYNRESGGEA